MQPVAKYYESHGNRYYTNIDYIWYGGRRVLVSTTSGDDEWDTYNGVEESEKWVDFDSLPLHVQEALKGSSQTQPER